MAEFPSPNSHPTSVQHAGAGQHSLDSPVCLSSTLAAAVTTDGNWLDPSSVDECRALVEALPRADGPRSTLKPYLDLLSGLPNLAHALFDLHWEDGRFRMAPSQDYWNLRRGLEREDHRLLVDLCRRLVEAYADDQGATL